VAGECHHIQGGRYPALNIVSSSGLLVPLKANACVCAAVWERSVSLINAANRQPQSVSMTVHGLSSTAGIARSQVGPSCRYL
jgi:hypothetical protein